MAHSVYEFVDATTDTTGVNATSLIALGNATFTASADCVVRPQVRLTNLAGTAANITLIFSHQNGAGVELGKILVVNAEAKHLAADTTWEAPINGGVFLLSGEKLVVKVLSSNASDTAVKNETRWLIDRASRVVVIDTDAITAESVKADAVTKIQNGLMTTAEYTAPDNTLTLTSLGAALDARHLIATYIDRLDQAVSAKRAVSLAAADVTGNLPADVKAYTLQPTVIAEAPDDMATATGQAQIRADIAGVPAAILDKPTGA